MQKLGATSGQSYSESTRRPVRRKVFSVDGERPVRVTQAVRTDNTAVLASSWTPRREIVEHEDIAASQRLSKPNTLRICPYFYFLFAAENLARTETSKEVLDGCHVSWAHGWAHGLGAGKPRPFKNSWIVGWKNCGHMVIIWLSSIVTHVYVIFYEDNQEGAQNC